MSESHHAGWVSEWIRIECCTVLYRRLKQHIKRGGGGGGPSYDDFEMSLQSVECGSRERRRMDEENEKKQLKHLSKMVHLWTTFFMGQGGTECVKLWAFFFNLTSFTSHFTTLSAFLPSPHQHCVSLLRRKKWERKNSTHKQKWKVCALSTMLKLLERTRRESSRNIWFNVQRHLNHFSPNRYIDNTQSERNKSIYSHFVLVITRPDPLPVFSLFFFCRQKLNRARISIFSLLPPHTRHWMFKYFSFFFRVAISSRKIITFAACERDSLQSSVLRLAPCSSHIWRPLVQQQHVREQYENL